MIRALVRLVDQRLGGAPFLRNAMHHAFPDHWSFMLGELAAYCFMFLILTGSYLALFFHPSDTYVVYQGSGVPSLDGRLVNDAYASVLNISFQVQAGLLFRQAHHWAALVFVGAITVHMARVFFTGAFRKPRDINWPVGVTLLLTVIGEGFCGYELLGDNMGGAGLRIATAVASSIPVIGSYVSYFFFGYFPGPFITNRLFELHIFLLPLVIAGLVTVHVALVWVQKHTQFPGPGRSEHNVVGSPLWPHYALKSVALMLATFGALFLLGGLVEIDPVWEYGPSIPWAMGAPSQPDYYVGWLEGALRLWPRWRLDIGSHTISTVFWPTVVMPLAVFGLMYAWPFLERTFITHDDRDHELLEYPWQNPIRTAAGVWMFTYIGVLLLAGGDDVQARLFAMSVQKLAWFYRGAALVLPPLAAVLAYRICRELKARHAYESEHPERALLVRAEGGGYEEGGVIPTPP